MVVIPVLLCGGVGKRLWPISTPEKPKPFHFFGLDHSMFQQTLLRCRAPLFHKVPIVVANSLNRSLVMQQLQSLDVKASIIWEPEGRNSCAAIAMACLEALKRDDNPVLLVQACDHLIEPKSEFIRSCEEALPLAGEFLMTFGMPAKRPETGFGYIKCGKLMDGEISNRSYAVERFAEKPDENTAQYYCDEGYLWNSGNFLIDAKLFLGDLKTLQPKMYEAILHAFETSTKQDMEREFSISSYHNIQPISVDHAIFQHTKKAGVIKADFSWVDIGSWSVIAELLKDGEPQHRELAETSAVFGQSDVYEKRPWGEFNRLVRGDGYQIKRLEVDPGQTLSLQAHQFRSEHWIIVSGQAEITLGDAKSTVLPDQSIHIPKGAIHRISNEQSVPLILIEVQLGEYLEEDDIIRLEDVYDRCSDDT